MQSSFKRIPGSAANECLKWDQFCQNLSAQKLKPSKKKPSILSTGVGELNIS